MERRNPPFARIRNRPLNGKVHDVCRVRSRDVFRIAQEFLRPGYSDQSGCLLRSLDVLRIHLLLFSVVFFCAKCKTPPPSKEKKEKVSTRLSIEKDSLLRH
jgi:hypothetical protein